MQAGGASGPSRCKMTGGACCYLASVSVVSRLVRSKWTLRAGVLSVRIILSLLVTGGVLGLGVAGRVLGLGSLGVGVLLEESEHSLKSHHAEVL
jgi:hypothetical protein